MNVKLAEERSEQLVLVNGQFLIAKKNDQIFGESVVNFVKLLVAERLGEINAMDLGTNCWC